MARRAFAAVALLAAMLVSVGGTRAGAASDVDPAPSITTVAGTPGAGPALGVAQLPHAIVLRGADLYVADPASDVVRAIRLSDGMERVVAGNGSPVQVAADTDGPDALTSSLYSPVSIAFDPLGNLFIAEAHAGRIRKVTPSGQMAIVAGTGTWGFGGDGGPATSAKLCLPEGVAADRAGNLYIADFCNDRIRRLDAATGTISTFAGTGDEGGGGDGGPASAAQLRKPEALAIDTGGTALLVADTGNSRIRRIDLETGLITTVAGTGTDGSSGDGGPARSAQLQRPAGVVAHPDGGFVIADTLNHSVRRVDATGRITLVAGNGTRHYGMDGVPATDTNLFAPEGVAVAPDGTVFIGDTRASRVRWVDAGGTIHAIGGTYYPNWNGDGPGWRTQLSQVSSVAVAPNGDAYISDTFNSMIRRVGASDGWVERIAGNGQYGTSGDGGPAAAAQLGTPRGIAMAPDGDVIFADSAQNRVRRIDSPSGVITTVVGTGVKGFAGDGGPARDAALSSPFDVALAPDGSLLVADMNNHRVRRVGVDGTITTVAGSGASTHSGDGGPATRAGIPDPVGLAVAPDGTIYVSALGTGRIRRILPSGVVDTYAGTGTSAFNLGDGGPATAAEVWLPWGLDLDEDGNLYIAEGGRHRIRRVDTHGIITTVAGNGRTGWAGDGGSPTAARLNYPMDVAVDVAGRSVFIAEFEGLRLRRAGVTPPPPPPPTPTTTTTTTATTTTTTTTTTTSAPPPRPAPSLPVARPPRSGYWMAGSSGSVYAFGDAQHLGNVSLWGGNVATSIATTPTGSGYWMVTADGSVHTFGDAPHLGGTPALRSGERVTSISAHPSGSGYWLFTTHGRAHSYGVARHLGDMSAARLNGPVIGSVATPTGNGYYMVASDGGIFAFGDAGFRGSMGARSLNGPVVGLAPDPDGVGYWLVGSDGGIFAFDTPFRGSMGGQRLNQPVIGMVAYGDGYLMVASDGGIFSFSSKPFVGSLGGSPPSNAIVAVAPLNK